ncbi:hypothetical protein ABT147_19890 [Streptomyces sp. NPDC001868]|uniref:hypothetical protein n=1 Tax=Streptomyces sp. NPDC001868 TaxID=3154401 RepID=UPI00331F2CD6
MMTRSRIFVALLAILLSILIGSGCSRGGGSSESVLNNLKSLARQADQLRTTIPESANSSELSAFREEMSELSTELAAVPDNLSSAELAAREAALAAQLRLATAIRQAEIPQTAATLTDNSRPSNVARVDAEWVTLRDSLKKTGEDYIKQFACEQAWTALTPEKKLEQNPPTTNWFTDATEQTIQGYIDTRYRDWKSTAIGQYVAWAQYSNGLFEKMKEFASQGQLAAPAQAYVYYVRYCQTPPIP